MGSVISTRKSEKLTGNKFMIIEPLERGGGLEKGSFVAVDRIGAGVGEKVLVATGSAARIGGGLESSPVDMAIVGIIDEE